MATTLLMSDEQADLMVFLIDWYTDKEDFEEATNLIINDPSHPDAETMLEAVSGIHQQFAQLQDLREQLTRIRVHA